VQTREKQCSKKWLQPFFLYSCQADAAFIRIITDKGAYLQEKRAAFVMGCKCQRLEWFRCIHVYSSVLTSFEMY
ncbi:hypothetical protein B4N84_18445, partial [Flavobacterium sp. IR1]